MVEKLTKLEKIICIDYAQISDHSILSDTQNGVIYQDCNKPCFQCNYFTMEKEHNYCMNQEIILKCVEVLNN